jgi:hypothetical protein
MPPPQKDEAPVPVNQGAALAERCPQRIEAGIAAHALPQRTGAQIGPRMGSAYGAGRGRFGGALTGSTGGRIGGGTGAVAGTDVGGPPFTRRLGSGRFTAIATCSCAAALKVLDSTREESRVDVGPEVRIDFSSVRGRTSLPGSDRPHAGASVVRATGAVFV